jgi:IS30 family transposase
MNPKKQFNQLGYEERQTISIGQEQGLSIRAIARILKRAPSTISREISRNGGGGAYSCRFAQQRHVRTRRHSRPPPKLVVGNPLFVSVQALLQQRWSPQQITGHLAKLHPHESASRVSHETIYNVIYAQPRGELRCDLIACLRMARAKRWPRSRGEDRRGQIADLLSIHLRPPEIEDRQFPGHWEGDLIKGAANASAVGTLVCGGLI